MNVLLLGATGFIGRHVCARLLQGAHNVTAAVRNVESAKRRFPGIRTFYVDMNRMTAPADWASLLNGIDAVVNCAGILQSGRGQSANLVHAAAPRALFDACLAHHVRRVIQISAVSADMAAGSEYALTKKAADDYLRSLDLDWIVLRPSLVYAQGSYGGTSVIRGLAGFPFFMPMIGSGEQKFQPIHAEDLAETVARCLSDPALVRHTLDPVGPETVSLRQLVTRTRQWLDLPPAQPLIIPRWLAAAVARIGDVVGRGPIRTTSLVQMEYGNISDTTAFQSAIGFQPRTMEEIFRTSPSHIQDRWHARLYFLYPALTVALAILWLGSGFSGFLNPPSNAEAIAARIGMPQDLLAITALGLSILDIVIGATLLTGRWLRSLGALQLALVILYTLCLSWAEPSLWIDSYGPLLKNLSILAAIATWMALGEDT
jgi:uncharacterized protein YbjT (DUF2867 family)/uncharacterized membrane protein YphA (DoxX/SURF4 family)